MEGEYSIITVTFPDKDLAKRISKLLVEKQLAACAQLFSIESVYRWQDKICDEGEIMVFIKSKTILFDKIAEEIRKCHPYEVPEIVQFPIINGFSEYLNWVGDCTTYEE